MTEETRKKIEAEYEEIRKCLRKPVDDRHLAFCQGRLAGILFVYGLLDEEKKENEEHELLESLKNLMEEVNRYIENAFVNKALCKEECEKYMRGVYDGQSRAYMVMRDKLEDIVIQFEENEDEKQR